MLGYISPMDRAADELFGWDDLFRGFERALRQHEGGSYGAVAPGDVMARVGDERDGYRLTVELPGVTDKDVNVDIHDGVLTVSAKRIVTPPEGYRVHRRERRNVEFSRSFALGDQVDPEKATAKIVDGVLTVFVPRAPHKKPRQIPVKSA